MARTKEFDPDAALQAALELFWERGYEATSVADLTGHLGIGRASLYATFGGKHELFLKALDRYRENTDAKLLAELSQPGAALPTVRAVVRRFADEAVREQRHRGCLITNTATELAARDPDAARRVRASWDTLETLTAGALARAQAQGELAPEKDPRALARLLLTVMQGMRVIGKAGDDPRRVTDAADLALSLLD
ncbi:TetR/AcrR family transcriptional regulator [Kitasatospora sp. DSM 101779]|uniref:TetR/AcrR family transcriptional regulator n=1 Tax=Kitasatospora sp. DSM 101779 TaxID=2853165 RepID=UPI0021DB3FC0|nr:TetR/AcrR family transcriptional regulator [Kitasatospora sp. DSM 101779]MCU7825912.1 TetR/AcrR family transcriptional regulator [Kitasatospora sp. DSM 101779]